MGYGGHSSRYDAFAGIDIRPAPRPRPFLVKLRTPVDFDKLEAQALNTLRRLKNPHKRSMANSLLNAVRNLREGGNESLRKAQNELKRFDGVLKDHFAGVLPAPFGRMYLKLLRNDLRKLCWPES